ncbi:hypothetical protein WDU94_011176, partial [Cyamophila willieti]
MIKKRQSGSKLKLFKLFILNQIIALIDLAQGRIGTFEMDTHFEYSLYDRNYFENFLEPDSEEFRHIGVCPKLWHVKETLPLLKMWGYPGEEHTITTEDGYIMSLFRVKPTKENARPVLILHGYLAAPEIFLIRGKEDLPMVLTDAGYDVWLGSYRGSHYGRRHVTLTIEDDQFWDFSFHEHGYYDAPAMIDHILQVTKSPRVSCIGHSMGTAAFMVMLALRPEYNDKINMFVGLGPYAVARAVMNRPKKFLHHHFMELVSHNKNTNPTDVFRRRKINPFAGFCWSFPRLCVWTINQILGPSILDERTLWTLVPVLSAYVVSGSSNKNYFHIVAIKNATFVQYDYGPKENLVRYNSSNPPAYNLTNVKVPVSLYYGETDELAGVKVIFSHTGVPGPSPCPLLSPRPTLGDDAEGIE